MWFLKFIDLAACLSFTKHDELNQYMFKSKFLDGPFPQAHTYCGYGFVKKIPSGILHYMSMYIHINE